MREALIKFIEAVLEKEIGNSEKERVCLQLKDFNPIDESELSLTFGYTYSPKGKVIVWSSDRNKFPETLTIQAAVDKFLTHYGLL